MRAAAYFSVATLVGLEFGGAASAEFTRGLPFEFSGIGVGGFELRFRIEVLAFASFPFGAGRGLAVGRAFGSSCCFHSAQSKLGVPKSIQGEPEQGATRVRKSHVTDMLKLDTRGAP